MSNKSMYYSATGTGYISTPSFAIPNTGVLTVNAWMNSKLSVTSTQSIVGEDAWSGTIGFIRMLRVSNTNGLRYYYADGTAPVSVDFSSIFLSFDDQWIYITVVCDYANKTIKSYRNGVQFDETKALAGDPVFPSASRIKFIGAHNPLAGRITDGSLDEVRIYNRGLSPTEVLEHYNGIFKDESNLQLYYNFNEDSGTTVLDGSGNGRNGTMYGSTSREEFPIQIRGSISNVQGVESITG